MSGPAPSSRHFQSAPPQSPTIPSTCRCHCSMLLLPLQSTTYVWLAGQPAKFTTTWQQYCMFVVQPPVSSDPAFNKASTTYYYAIEIGNAASNTVYYFDDFSLTAEPNNL